MRAYTLSSVVSVGVCDGHRDNPQYNQAVEGHEHLILPVADDHLHLQGMQRQHLARLVHSPHTLGPVHLLPVTLLLTFFILSLGLPELSGFLPIPLDPDQDLLVAGPAVGQGLSVEYVEMGRGKSLSRDICSLLSLRGIPR